MVVCHEGNHHPPEVSIGEVGCFPRGSIPNQHGLFQRGEEAVTSSINLQEKQCGSSARSRELLTLILNGHHDDPLQLFTRYQVRLIQWIIRCALSVGRTVVYKHET